jgi:MFS family permease
MLIPFHSIAILLVSMIFLTFSEMLAMPFMSTHSMKRASTKTMGEYMALYSMSWSVALILAPFVGTQLIEYAGFNGLWVSVSVIGLISLLGFRFLESRH